MLFRTLKNCLRWSAINLACATMVLSPVAMGRESEALTEQKVKLYLQEFGLNQKTTLGEFWEKTKVYYPGYVYQDLERYVQENRNQLMPEVRLLLGKGTDGSAIPILRLSQDKKSATMQIFGSKDKWLKYNNVMLSEGDLRSVTNAFDKIEAGDAKVKKEADAYRDSKNGGSAQKKLQDAKYLETLVKDFARFRGFPRMTPDQWKVMTPEQRAGFIVNMRLLWKDARQVLRLEELANSKVTPKNNRSGKKYSSFEEFSKILLGEHAEAAAAVSTNKQSDASKLATSVGHGTSVVNAGAASAPANPQEKKCIVAGFVSIEGRSTNYRGEGQTCSDIEVFRSEKYSSAPEMKPVRDALIECRGVSANHVACNPLIYGYQSTGSAICVDRTKNAPSILNFQKATWWDGPCDGAAKLTSAQIKDNMKETSSSYADADKRYDESGNIKDAVAQKQIAAIEEDQKKESYKLTKSYLDSVIANKKRTNDKLDFNLDKLISGEKKWSKEIDDMLVEIQSQFEVEIGEAIQSCEKSITRKDNVDRNQKGACDQLHRRWLFTERFVSQFRAKACIGNSSYIWDLKDIDSTKQAGLAKFNKMKLASDSVTMCQCNNDPNKYIKFGDAKGCELPPPPPDAKCPEGMQENVKGFCTCIGGTEFFPMNEALASLRTDTLDHMCPGKPEKPTQQCDVPGGIENYDYTSCECSKGSLKDENEQSFLSKIFSKQEKKEPKWVCKESNWLPWVIFGSVLAVALFNRDKRGPITPALTCTKTCENLNRAACECSVAPGKCPDGSVRTPPSATRPNGCALGSEGGTGAPICTTPPCSGGLPSATGQ